MHNNYNKAIYRYKNNICNTNNDYQNRLFMNDIQIPINTNIGYLEIIVSAQRGQIVVSNAEVIVYARNDNSSVPVYNTVYNGSPIIISLPIAHTSGTLIRGPEYYFTTYDVTVEADGFAPYRCNNLRLFEGVTTTLDVCLTIIEQGQYPIPENIVNIPPHPRDEVISQSCKYYNSFK